LLRGLAAIDERTSPRFTIFDGLVPLAGADRGQNLAPHGSGRALSASALETAGRCPLAFFFRYPLGVRAVDELEANADQWLDPLAYGCLLHEVFHRFMSDLRRSGRLPDAARDERQLAATLLEHIQQYRDRIPPANEAAFRRQCRQLRRVARVFLAAESEFCKGSCPEFFETSVGLASVDASELGSVDPVSIALPDGRNLPIYGRIDRIDRVSDDCFAVWDYKSGSSSRFKPEDPFQNGRIVQNVIYLAIAEAVLRRHLSPAARVTEFGYFFPGEREWGHRISWSRADLEGGRQVVGWLAQIVAAGLFLPTNQQDPDCTFCDYRAACGDLHQITRAAGEKLANADNTVLEPLRKLRPHVD
jgi:ATP-dependent helicase/nuclease subunit B